MDLGIHWTGDWVSLRAGPVSADKRKYLNLSELELRPSQSVAIPTAVSGLMLG
jgi:hypothetical protein